MDDYEDLSLQMQLRKPTENKARIWTNMVLS